jgi:hypothetical protein
MAEELVAWYRREGRAPVRRRALEEHPKEGTEEERTELRLALLLKRLRRLASGGQGGENVRFVLEHAPDLLKGAESREEAKLKDFLRWSKATFGPGQVSAGSRRTPDKVRNAWLEYLHKLRQRERQGNLPEALRETLDAAFPGGWHSTGASRLLLLFSLLALKSPLTTAACSRWTCSRAARGVKRVRPLDDAVSS